MLDLDLKLVPEDAPILSAVTQPFNFVDPPIDPHALTKAMFETLRSAPGAGIGLAAPQVGLSHRMFVMDLNTGPRACFNPRIVATADEVERADEGCLSFPNLWLKVPRPIKAAVEYQNSNGVLQEERLSGLAARCFLHELDHLNGVLFVDLVGPLARKMAEKRRRSRGPFIRSAFEN